MDNRQYGIYGKLHNCIFQPSDLVGFGELLHRFSYIPQNPSSQRAEFALIAPAAQAERHSNKSAVVRENRVAGESLSKLVGNPTLALHPTAVQWQNKRVAEASSQRLRDCRGPCYSYLSLGIVGASRHSPALQHCRNEHEMSINNKKKQTLPNTRGRKTQWILSCT